VLLRQRELEVNECDSTALGTSPNPSLAFRHTLETRYASTARFSRSGSFGFSSGSYFCRERTECRARARTVSLAEPAARFPVIGFLSSVDVVLARSGRGLRRAQLHGAALSYHMYRGFPLACSNVERKYLSRKTCPGTPPPVDRPRAHTFGRVNPVEDARLTRQSPHRRS